MILSAICLFFALLPWLLYLLRFFLAPKTAYPSLVFLQEEEGLGVKLWHKLSYYALQSAFFVLLAIHFFPEKQENFFCLVDDHLRSQITATQFRHYQESYGPICGEKFYSLASLAENQLQEVSTEYLAKPSEPAPPSLVLSWLRKWAAHRYLIFTSENNYMEFGKNIFYARPSSEKKNYFFKSFLAQALPTDFRQYQISFSSQIGAQIFLERAFGEKIFISVKDELPQNLIIGMPPKSKSGILEVIRLVITNDEYPRDNELLLVLYWQQARSVQGKDIPKALSALLDMPDFPYFSLKPQGEKLFLEKASCPEPQPAFLDLPQDIFQKSAFSYSCPASRGQIYLRFTDGRAAVSLDKDRVYFWFDPDKVSETLLQHPEYALLLWKIVYEAPKELLVKHEFAHYHNKDFPAVIQGNNIIREPLFITPGELVKVINYHPKSSEISFQKIPTDRLVEPQFQEKAMVPWLLGALTLLIAIYSLPLLYREKV
ncbi:MAG: hypothetical protein NZM25_09105 [Leptospiraceae bacterium]|nr:hypothetical protein [Leptospiraceae bacterium]MDW8307297.1 hypothetical protein [Leptospiraceae bacterium]